MLADMDNDTGYVRAAGELRYQAILEDSRSLLDGPLAGGGGLPRGGQPGSDAQASIFATREPAKVEEDVEAEAA